MLSLIQNKGKDTRKVYDLKLLLYQVLHVIYSFAESEVSIKYDFGFIVQSSVKRRVTLAKRQTLKMYGFNSSLPNQLKFHQTLLIIRSLNGNTLVDLVYERILKMEF